MTGGDSGRRLRVLHLIINLGETNGQYNEHCLPMIGVRDLSICTYFEAQLTPPPEIALFEGDGSLFGFFRALYEAQKSQWFDVIHAHAPQTGALVVVALLAMFRIRSVRPSMVYTVQDSFYDYSLRNKVAMVIALAGFERIVFCSRAAYESVPAIWKSMIRDRWTVVQNGADFDRIDRALEDGHIVRDESRFTVIAVGRLEPVKDHQTLLEAFAADANDSTSLMVIGTGGLEAAVRAKVADLGLKDLVEFTGLIPRDEVFLRCAGADVLVSTSRGEGLPVAVIEAMATGCPVVLSDIAPHRELADGADFIPLIPLGNADGFAREIRKFREMPENEIRELGQLSRDHVMARYSLPIMHAGIDAVYRSL